MLSNPPIRPIVIVLMVSALGLTGCSSLLVNDYTGHDEGTSPGTFLTPIPL